MLEPEGMGDHDGMLRCQTRRGSASFLMAQEHKSAYRGCSGCPSVDETLDTAQRRIRDEAGHTSARVRGLPWYQHASLRSP